MNAEELSRLGDMLESARLIVGYAQGHDQSSFSKDFKAQDAIIRRIEIMAEASKHLSDKTKKSLKEIPFVEIRGMRNRIVHNYEDTSLDIVWHVATIEAPKLAAILEPLVSKSK